MKRFRADEDSSPPATAKKARVDEGTHVSSAAKFNDMVLRKLQRAFAANPEDDLLAKFPTEYSTRLAGRKKQDEDLKGAANGDDRGARVEKNVTANDRSENDDAAAADTARLSVEHTSGVKTPATALELPLISTATVVFPLSESIQVLLGAHADELSAASSSLWTKLYNFIDASETLYSNGRGGKAVLRCSANTAIKIIPDVDDYTEYTNLQYLKLHAPEVPVPEALGMLASEKTAYMFMSFVPGLTLESVWSQLPGGQKVSINNQLSRILLKVRELPFPKDGILGGVAGEGCKDTRRHTRLSKQPIKSVAEFEDFIFSNPHFGGSVYIKILRSMSQNHSPKVVFSHGDFRPANIVVQPDQQGGYSIGGILDWEMGGFYPDYWETVKTTNVMTPSEEDDWYLNLPACASPTSYPIHWLVDRKWDVHVA